MTLLTNGDFSSGLTDWSQTPSGIAVVTDGELVFTPNTANEQVYQQGPDVVDDTEYQLTFVARMAITGKRLRAQLVDGSDVIGLDETFFLTTSNDTYSVTFTATETVSNARFRFRCRDANIATYIDNVVLAESGTVGAEFNGTPTVGYAPLTVNFTDASTGAVTTWSWEYQRDGGGWIEFATTENPSFEFDDPGTYDIRLTVNSISTETKIGYLTISGVIEADFTGTPVDEEVPFNVVFTDASTATNTITERLWEYQRNGGGWVEFSTSEDPTLAVTLAGTYDIRLTVTSVDGSHTKTRTAYVMATSDSAVADFTGTPTSGSVPFNVVFTDASTGTITLRTWEYQRNGAGWIEFSTAEDPTLSITQAGTYDIRLTVSGDGSDTYTRTAYIVATGTDTLAVTIIAEHGTIAGQITTTFALEPETYYFVVASYDQTTGEANLYIDGALIESTSIGAVNLSGDGRIDVGGRNGDFIPNVLIDELFFLDRAIHPDEVRAVYESDAPIFAETSTWHWRTARNRLWADTSGMWMINASGTKVIGAYAGVEGSDSSFYTWGGVNLFESDVLIGDASRGGYLLWDDSAATVVLKGQMIIQAGSTGYANLEGIPSSLNDLDSAAHTKLDGIETGATVGADWGVNLGELPTWADGRLANIANESGTLVAPVVPTATLAPSGSGLYLGSDYMGFFSGGVFATYIANNGDFLFRGALSGDYIQWDASENRLQGVGGGVEQWYCDTDNGWLSAGAGAVWLNQYGLNISVDVLDDNRLRFVDAGTEVGAINFVKTLGGVPGPYDGLIFRNFNATGFHFLGTGQANFYQNVSLDSNDLYDINDLIVENTIEAGFGYAWKLGEYVASPQTPTGYVRVMIDGNTYYLIAREP